MIPSTARTTREALIAEEADRLLSVIDAVPRAEYCDNCCKSKAEHEFWNDRIYDVQGYKCPGALGGEYHFSQTLTASKHREARAAALVACLRQQEEEPPTAFERAQLETLVEAGCSFNCDAESSCDCNAHRSYRALLRASRRQQGSLIQQIEALVQKWNQQARSVAAYHAVMGVGWDACAKELADVLSVLRRSEGGSRVNGEPDGQ